ncbi:MAG: MBL fold metallo-hydrolase [Pseudomonadota bacterium]
MKQGWVRDWDKDRQIFFATLRSKGHRAAKEAQAAFRRGLKVPLHASADATSAVKTQLTTTDVLTLPNGLANGNVWTPVTVTRDGGAVDGYAATGSLVEIAYVGIGGAPANPFDDDPFKATIENSSGDQDLLWGDLVQIIERRGGVAEVMARGMRGRIATDRLDGEPLLEVYIIDVGQGDGVLIRYPDGSHMLIDGGLARDKQMTGKNAADFVDWKFFSDYGSWRIDLDWMIASHSDADHYGGLKDLIDSGAAAATELDCLEVRVDKFGHPGLSRFPKAVHSDKLGPRKSTTPRPVFTRLMGDRADAEALVDGSGGDGLKISGWWRDFVKATLENDADTAFARLSLDQADAGARRLPDLAPAGSDYAIRVLGPVTLEHDGSPALPDLGDTGKNTNGHSVCLRLDYGKARLLMTGDLNSKSMEWLKECYGAGMDVWACDMAKACHHGSHDVSFSFLQAINAAATVISSGDNEGHAHPRPEIVAASALSGHRELSADGERVVTPLIYMTEIERSALLAAVNRIEITDHSAAGDSLTLLGKPVEAFSGSEFFSEENWDEYAELDDADAKKDFRKEVVEAGEDRLGAVEEAAGTLGTQATLYGRRPAGVVDIEYPRRSLRGLRMMESNVYGLVNVRTDGERVMCASKRDSGNRWTIHTFKARFGGT